MAYEQNYGKSKRYGDGIIRRRGAKHVAEFNHGGKRLRKTFADEEGAKDWIDKQSKNVRNFGLSVMALNGKQITDAQDALSILSGYTSLSQAASFWMSHHQPAGGVMTISELVDEYVESKRGMRKRTYTDCKSRLKPLKDNLGDMGVHEVTPQILRDWIDSLGFENQKDNRSKCLRHARWCFTHAAGKGLIAENPLGEGKRWPTGLKPGSSGNEDEIAIMAVEDVKTLLHAAEFENPKVAVSLAIGFFAGLRTAEVAGLTWERVNLKTNRITIDAGIAKRAKRRVVDIEPNLREWLLKYREPSGRVCLSESRFSKVRLTVVNASGVVWYPNAARHGFGSYHFEKYGSYEKSMGQMGHDDVKTFLEHYKGLVEDPADANKYWAIIPKD